MSAWVLRPLEASWIRIRMHTLMYKLISPVTTATQATRAHLRERRRDEHVDMALFQVAHRQHRVPVHEPGLHAPQQEPRHIYACDASGSYASSTPLEISYQSHVTQTNP